MTIMELLTDPAKKVFVRNQDTGKDLFWNGSRWLVGSDRGAIFGTYAHEPNQHLSLDAAISDFKRRD